MPELCVDGAPRKREQGMPGARCTRGLVCKMRKKKAHTSIQVQRRQSGIPCAMVLRLMPCSPRRSGFFGTVALRILARPPGRARAPPQDLTPTSEASGPHGFAVRDQRRRPARRLIAHELIALRHRFRADAARVHRIPSRVRDDRDTPLSVGWDVSDIVLIWGRDQRR